MSAPPIYVPAHKLPTSISSDAVHEEIRNLAKTGADKAFCWDMTQAIYRLVERTQAQTQEADHGG